MTTEEFQSTLAGRYRVDRELGRGGMAVVYLAEDLRHRRRVAIKALSDEVSRGIGTDRFEREIETVARLSHPHILPLYDSGEAAGALYYVMPFAEGKSLRDRLNREHQLPIDDAIRIARDVAVALDYAHRQGVIHRDIKPENILFQGGEGAPAVIADFGIARVLAEGAVSATLTAAGHAVGTPAYMSPEQASGEREIDGRSDLYSLGCVLYEMLAGEPPFTGPTAQALILKRLSAPPPRVRGLRDTVPPAVEQAILRALSRSPADRFATALDFARALEAGTPSSSERDLRPIATTSRPRRGLFGAGAGVIGVVAAAIAALLFSGDDHRAVLDTNLLAVAPFDVLDEQLALWREGLVDVLSRNLDGAGALRTVPPTIVVRRWSGRADPASAGQLARQTGAGLALIGTLERVEGDSVRVRAEIRDVVTDRVLARAERRELVSAMDRLSDSLTVTLLRELGRVRPVGAVRFTAVRSTNLPTLKAFLQGEQFFRSGAYDSARTYYEVAIANDSTYALAIRRLAVVWGWLRGGPADPMTTSNRIRADRFNRGFGARDSIIIHAESLHAAVFLTRGDTADALVRRLISMLEEALRVFPEDPELWDVLADSRFHFNAGTTRETLNGFRRAIELDSLFALAYPHAVQIAMESGDTAAVRRYSRVLMRLNPSPVTAEANRLIVRLLDTSGALAERDSLLDAASLRALHDAVAAWEDVPDDEETGIVIGRAYLTRSRRSPAHAQDHLAAALAFRGHLREAAAIGAREPRLHGELQALLGAVGEGAAAEPASSNRGASAHPIISWATRDTASLAGTLSRAMSGKRSADPLFIGFRRHRIGMIEALLELARGDSSGALARLRSLPDSLCTTDCNLKRLTEGVLLAARGDMSALDRLEPLTGDVVSPMRVVFALERARAGERFSRRDVAIEDYGLVVRAWNRADTELQPFVAEARRALDRLGTDRRAPNSR
ncbi:MAG: protein kinase domain-containing protein [Gemmatimonadaceae bacterium]